MVADIYIEDVERNIFVDEVKIFKTKSQIIDYISTLIGSKYGNMLKKENSISIYDDKLSIEIYYE